MLDLDALEALAAYGGTIDVDGSRVPVLHPRGDVADYMDLDRALCAAGLVAFIRPAIAGEAPFDLAGWVLVREIVPGVRVRLDVGIRWLSPERN